MINFLDESAALSNQRFDEHVARGAILRHEAMDEVSGVRLRHILFALPGEEWRFAEYLALMRSASEGWSNAKERRRGELLGYTDAQNDEHLSR